MTTWSTVTSTLSADGLTWRNKNTTTAISTIDATDGRVQFDKFVGFGTLTTPTIVSGVLTVTGSFVNPLPESSTSDTVDSIVMTGVQAGDMLMIHVPATNTITFDDAAINLAAATRAVAPGGSLWLIYDGTEWSELFFTAATDNT
jgi:hypothetical protein